MFPAVFPPAAFIGRLIYGSQVQEVNMHELQADLDHLRDRFPAFRDGNGGQLLEAIRVREDLNVRLVPLQVLFTQAQCHLPPPGRQDQQDDDLRWRLLWYGGSLKDIGML